MRVKITKKSCLVKKRNFFQKKPASHKDLAG